MGIHMAVCRCSVWLGHGRSQAIIIRQSVILQPLPFAREQRFLPAPIVLSLSLSYRVRFSDELEIGGKRKDWFFLDMRHIFCLASEQTYLTAGVLHVFKMCMQCAKMCVPAQEKSGV
jgi:hypothetical protein